MPPLLIRNATLLEGGRIDVRVVEGHIVEMGALPVVEGEHVVDAAGGLLLPGLHDHHIHCAATAAARASVQCGPPDVADAETLAARLAAPGEGWLRGVGYHDSVAGDIDRRWIDRVAPDRPVRIQHRSGRLWIFNSAGLAQLLVSGLPPPQGLDRDRGHLFDDDVWMRRALGGTRPALDALGGDLARLGVTGLTDMSPANGPEEHRWFVAEQASGALPQRVMLAGAEALAACAYDERLMPGPVKVHLHEAQLPDHDALIARIVAAHAGARGVAVHCVTEVELVFTLAAFEEAGVHAADRIEHASVAPDALVARIAALGLPVVVQPLFPFERGDAYRRDIAQAEWPYLYRLRAFREAGVAMAGSSDAPYVDIDPWAAMRTATDRRTRDGATLGEMEAIEPEAALALYLADPVDVRRQRKVAPGVAADLCLLDQPWEAVRGDLSADHVRLTMIAGRIVHDRVDEAPA
ncbi:MAG TPA: amidohydrolase family protein [Sphingobium sp.]